MNKDELEKMKVRENIITAIINVKGDMELIPALVDYAETGDLSLFEEYKKIRLASDTEKELREFESRLEKEQKDLEHVKSKLEDVQKDIKDRKKQISDAILWYQEWLDETMKATSKKYPSKKSPNLKNLRDFSQKCIDKAREMESRKLWVKDGDKLKVVTAIMWYTNEFVLDVGEDATILPPVPKYYNE